MRAVTRLNQQNLPEAVLLPVLVESSVPVVRESIFAIEDLLKPVNGDERVLEIDNDAGPRQKARLAGDARSDSGAFANGNMIR